MEIGTGADIEQAGVEPAVAERGTEDGTRAVPASRGARRDERGEQEPGDLQSNIVLGED
ncbi:hypothetical protein [Streptomyces ureilyticus]|uniref:Uncharacterized protein n=1 Tax=Streptomyces ureilyticus TaxID=1775131 RepID=A0ABX0DWG4_9ACTN|nr:hypothetical protein [Streptomyces ureilyticus]NGO46270.1 hypothetical protein [Streptomyces ureilyticus]